MLDFCAQDVINILLPNESETNRPYMVDLYDRMEEDESNQESVKMVAALTSVSTIDWPSKDMEVHEEPPRAHVDSGVGGVDGGHFLARCSGSPIMEVPSGLLAKKVSTMEDIVIGMGVM